MGKIIGKVQLPDGRPVANCPVAIVASSTPHLDLAAVTAADGSFAFGGVADGWYELRALSSLSSRITVKGRKLATVVLTVSPESIPDDLHEPVGSDG